MAVKTKGAVVSDEKTTSDVERDGVIIRFAGDSGDGMQITGSLFTQNSALVGYDISTFPDFPAEIRAPAGTLPGVSGFQLNFSSLDIRTPGDAPDALVAFNPAALKANLHDLVPGGLLILNEDTFRTNNLKKAGYESDPREGDELDAYRVISVQITKLTTTAVEPAGLGRKEGQRAKNMFALGMVHWIYDRPLEQTIRILESKFAKKPAVFEANRLALQAGYNYADTMEIAGRTRVAKAVLPKGKYRMITGNEATAMGFVAAAKLAGRQLMYGSYPITPASDILHSLARFKGFGVRTFQAEDELSAIGAAIGASFAGAIGLTGTSGPGLALKSEALGLAVMTELPLVVINVQRGGPSTGLPTKTEQADLLQAMYGRNGECPVCIVAAATPGDCFHMAIEAVRLAVQHMMPVIFLSDGYLANGAEPWIIPKVADLPAIDVHFCDADPAEFQPYQRDPETLARPWAIPGTPGLEHRLGGLEKDDITGDVSYDPANHEHMVKTRAAKVERIARDIPELEVYGDSVGGDLLVIGWGGTYGAITSAVEKVRQRGGNVSSAHLRYLNPFPPNLGDVLARFDKVLVPELNLGQLYFLLRGKFSHEMFPLNKVQGLPFKVSEIEVKIEELL